MDTESALLADILSKPDDDLPRLVYADWLDENAAEPCSFCGGSGQTFAVDAIHGDGRVDNPRPAACMVCSGSGRASDGRAERAEFIRLAIEIERRGGYYGACQVAHPNALVGCGSCPACEITKRMDALIEDGDPHDITAGWQIAPQWAWSYRVYENVAPCQEAIVRRGFVAECRCRLADWIGGECGRCGGDGRFYDDEYLETPPCPACHGTGRTVGIGPQIVAAHPVEWVECSDREPAQSEWNGRWYWVTERRGEEFIGNRLPYGLLKIMAEIEGDDLDGRDWRDYHTSAAAIAALSAACLAWAKYQSNQPPLIPVPTEEGARLWVQQQMSIRQHPPP